MDYVMQLRVLQTISILAVKSIHEGETGRNSIRGSNSQQQI